MTDKQEALLTSLLNHKKACVKASRAFEKLECALVETCNRLGITPEELEEEENGAYD